MHKSSSKINPLAIMTTSTVEKNQNYWRQKIMELDLKNLPEWLYVDGTGRLCFETESL